MASTTKYVTLRGKVKWCRNKNVNKFGRWSVDIYPDDESLAIIDKELKSDPAIKNTMKQDEDGKYMTFSRDPQRLVRGKMVLFDPPKTVDVKDAPFDGNIGNSSDCDIVLQVYTWGGSNNIAPGRAARLHAIKVYSLVEFDSNKDYTIQEHTDLRGLQERPPMPQW
jgi:hypothetical protein